MTPITLTIDLEDQTAQYDAGGRYAVMARKVLELCDTLDIKATFFTVGRLAAAAPSLIRDIAQRGHEIAYHSHAHIPLTEDDPANFRRESLDDKTRLEQLAGKPVSGFRAPEFSLTPQTLWATDILAELGFCYSSSIMPTHFSRHGFPGAPRTPFAWPNGLIEFPLPVEQIGSLRVPYLGGIYLYALPFPLVRLLASRAPSDNLLWTYAHPYDFDTEAPFAPMPNTPLWISLVLWLARRRAEPQIKRVMELGQAKPLGERLTTITPRLTFPQTRS